MILTLSDDDGTVLDTMTVNREDWDDAQRNHYAAQSILASLQSGFTKD